MTMRIEQQAAAAPRGRPARVGSALGAVAVLLLALAACDVQKMENMEVGSTTEAQVRQQWGTPDATYTESDGAQVLEFSRQPAGQKNYMIVIGTDGKLRAIRQVLVADTIAKVKQGMTRDEVRRLIGKPGAIRKYELKPDEEVWQWRWLDGSEAKVLNVTFGAEGRATSTMIGPDRTKDGT